MVSISSLAVVKYVEEVVVTKYDMSSIQIISVFS